MRVVKLTPDHVRALQVQQAQTVDYVGAVSDDVLAALAAGDSWTLLDGDVVLACGGYYKQWPGRYLIWALLGDSIGPVGMLILTRVAMRYCQLLSGSRIEAVVREGFDAGHRWMRLLGFKLETPDPMLRYMPDGGAAFLYSRVM